MDKRISNRWFVNLLLAVAALGLSLSLVSTARAQSTTDGAIAGTVYDQSGAVIPGATVVVHNNGTNAEETVTTDASGNYKATKLEPAVYTVTITARGFETFKAEQVVVAVGSVTNVIPRMTVGSTAQTVEITGVAPQVNTTSADFTSTLNQTAIASLPIQRARWSAFSQMTPGVVQDSNGFGLLSFRGVSTLLNNVTVDGADDNQAFFSEQRGRTRISYSDSEESVQEFQVNTSNYSAEYGRAAGGVVNTVTKSGTNNWHGDVSYKNRENGWAARNPFGFITELNPPGSPTPSSQFPIKPTDYWDIEAGSLGGPIKKDKLFFFVSYDNFYRKFPGVSAPSTPAAFYAAPLSAATVLGVSPAPTCTIANNTSPGVLNGITSSNSIFGTNSTEAGYLFTATSGACKLAGIVMEAATAPAGVTYPYTLTAAQFANGVSLFNTGLAGLESDLGTTPRTGKQGIIFPKLDWQINSRNRATFEVNRMRWISPYGVQTQVVNAYGTGSGMGNDNVSDTWGVGKVDTTISPNVINEARYQIGMDFEWESQPPPNAYENNELFKTTAGSATYPSWATYTNPTGYSTYASLTNGFALGTAYYDLRYQYPRELRNQVADTVTWSRGNHTMKFGGDFMHTADTLGNIYQQNGSFSYSSGVTGYLSDLYSPSACNGLPCASNYSGFSQGFGTLTFKVPTDDLALFAQDDWKVTPRLSFSLGLRWEYEHLPAPINPNPAVPQTTFMPEPKTNFGPRASFAWDLFGDGKTAVRGGFGIYYGRIMSAQIFSVVTQSGLIQNGVVTGQPSYAPNAASSTFGGQGFFPEIFNSFPVISGSTPIPGILYFNSHYKNPQVDEVDFSFEREIGWNTVFSLSYIGSFGHFLPQLTDDNIAQGTNASGSNPILTYDVGGGGPITSQTLGVPFYAYRPNPNYTQMGDIFGVSSNYNALVIEAKHRMNHSIQFDANFTWAHALDYDTSTISSTSITATSGYNMLTPNNIGQEYANSNLDVPRRVVVYMVADSPWHMKSALKYLTDGWELSPIFEAQDGLPYNATVSGTAPCDFTSNSCPGNSLISSGGGYNGSDGVFRLPGRNSQRERPTQDIDIRMSKTFPIKERVHLMLFGEAFNLFNHYNVQTQNTEAYSVSTSGSITDTTGANQTCTKTVPCLSYFTGFNAVTAANNTYQTWTRQLQLGFRLDF